MFAGIGICLIAGGLVVFLIFRGSGLDRPCDLTEQAEVLASQHQAARRRAATQATEKPSGDKNRYVPR